MAVVNNKPFAVKGKNVTSPKGKALWCKFKEPDRLYNAKGELSTNLVCDPNDPAVKAFIKELETLRDTAMAEAVETLGAAKAKGIQAAAVYKDDIDKDGNETGLVKFTFKLKDVDDKVAQGKQATVLVVDAKRQPIPLATAPLVGNGSEIRCVAYANPYYMASTKTVGVSMMWSKMQVINLVSYDSDDFDDEDGFTSNEEDYDIPFNIDSEVDF
jgi:hypothetical protein